MTALLCNIALALLLWAGAYAAYLGFNHGLAPNARLQQLLRYMAAAVVAVVPMAVTATSPLQPAVVPPLAAAVMWIVSYPLTYHLTHRRHAPDYDHQIDGSFAIYVFGFACGLLLLPMARMVVGALIFLLLLIPIGVWVYYLACHHVIDAPGMQMLQETHYNEIIEYLHSYPLRRTLAAALLLVLVAAVCIAVPLRWPVSVGAQWWQWALAMAATAFMGVYLWKPHHGLFVRTGIVQLYNIVANYVINNRQYTSQQQQRLHSLQVRCATPLPRPHTLMLVIGESASRDFMSAFTPMADDTTPWLRQLSRDTQHCVLFPHAYSCDIQTVPTLEKALTEYCQYGDGGQFYTSCSIVDMAHKLGYRVHWYSNQGHLGAADTPVTLVAETADVAKWTRQQLGRPQYDETLVDFLAEVDPTADNLVVIHLKGSHFNYENRFTEQTRQWGAPGDYDQTSNYKNTLYYTDTVLQRLFEQARQRLNLQAMVYCSDHADVPNRHRQPNFGGFRDTRIPLMVWMSDDYLRARPHRADALRANRQRYWTNDLLYELLCGVMDAESNHFCDDRSLASPRYRFDRGQLTAMNGQVRIADDNQADGCPEGNKTQ